MLKQTAICDECGRDFLSYDVHEDLCVNCAGRLDEGPVEEPIDEGLAYLDRLDGWHGPHHG